MRNTEIIAEGEEATQSGNDNAPASVGYRGVA